MIDIELMQYSQNHKKIHIGITKTNFQRYLDIYYYVLAVEGKSNTEEEIIINISELIKEKLLSIKTKILSIKKYQSYLLPLEYEDEYIGCFRIYKKADNLEINWGYLLMGGYSVEVSNHSFLDLQVGDFIPNSDYLPILMDINSFCECMDKNISHLNS